MLMTALQARASSQQIFPQFVRTHQHVEVAAAIVGVPHGVATKLRLLQQEETCLATLADTDRGDPCLERVQRALAALASSGRRRDELLKKDCATIKWKIQRRVDKRYRQQNESAAEVTAWVIESANELKDIFLQTIHFLREQQRNNLKRSVDAKSIAAAGLAAGKARAAPRRDKRSADGREASLAGAAETSTVGAVRASRSAAAQQTKKQKQAQLTSSPASPEICTHLRCITRSERDPSNVRQSPQPHRKFAFAANCVFLTWRLSAAILFISGYGGLRDLIQMSNFNHLHI